MNVIVSLQEKQKRKAVKIRAEDVAGIIIKNIAFKYS